MAVLVIVSARQEGNEAIEATRQHLAGDNTPKSHISVTKVPSNFERHSFIGCRQENIRWILSSPLPPSRILAN